MCMYLYSWICLCSYSELILPAIKNGFDFTMVCFLLQGIEQMNTLENMFSNLDDRSSTDSPVLNVNPWGAVPQTTTPGAGLISTQAHSQTNHWPNAAAEPFEQTSLGMTNVTATDSFPSFETSTRGGNMFSSRVKSSMKPGSNITADLFSGIETTGTSSSVFGVTTSNPGVENNLSSRKTTSNISADLFSGLDSSSMFGASTIPATSIVGNGFSNNQQASNMGSASQIGAFQSKENMAIFAGPNTQSVNVTNPFSVCSKVQIQTPAPSSSQFWGNVGHDFQQPAAGLTALVSSGKNAGHLTHATSGQAVNFPQPPSHQQHGQTAGFTSMPPGTELATTQLPMLATSSQPFQQVAGGGISVGSQFRSSPVPGMSVVPPPISSISAQNLTINPAEHNPFESAQPTVAAVSGFSNQQVPPSTHSFPLDSMQVITFWALEFDGIDPLPLLMLEGHKRLSGHNIEKYLQVAYTHTQSYTADKCLKKDVNPT